MKSIMIITSQAFSLENFRGELIRQLCDQGWKVSCAAPDMTPLIGDRLKKLGASAHLVSGNRAKISVIADIFFIYDIFRLMRDQKPDAVLLYFIKPILYGAIVSKVLSIKRRVLLLEGMGYVFTENSILVRWLLRPNIKLLYKLAIFCSNRVVVLNEDDKLLISDMTKNKDKILKIEGIGVNLEVFKPDPEVPSRQVTYDFAYFGRFLVHKGILEIVEASRLLKERGYSLRIAFYGHVDENPSSVSLNEIMQWQEDGLIEHCGFTNDVVSAMRNCRVLLLPSYREALPRTCQEAAAMGIPSIVSDVPGCREVVVNRSTGLVVKVKDHVDLANKMEIYINDPNLVDLHGVNSINRARDIYDAKKINQQMIKLFN